MTVAVVVNPAKVRRAKPFRALIDGELARRGHPPARYLPTTIASPGAAQARAALAAGAGRVLVAGGDGTIRMVLGALRDTGVPVGILPVGTGNLLARNLRLPLRLRPAVRVALGASTRALDLIRYEVPGEHGYAAVMAGLGADAAVVADAAHLKRLGHLGYAVAGLRHLRARPVDTRITVGATTLSCPASLMAVGNLPELRRGLRLFPDANGADGKLSVLAASPRHTLDVLRMGAEVLARAGRIDGVDRLAGREVEVQCARPVPCQVDGDLIGAVTTIRFEVLPAAALVAAR